MGSEPRSVTPAVLSSDTTAEMERRQVAIWRAMAPAEKLALVNRASLDAAALALAGIRSRHPGISDRECFLRLAELRLGSSLVRAAYPDATTLLGPR
jgi:hypothetical protein